MGSCQAKPVREKRSRAMSVAIIYITCSLRKRQWWALYKHIQMYFVWKFLQGYLRICECQLSLANRTGNLGPEILSILYSLFWYSLFLFTLFSYFLESPQCPHSQNKTGNIMQIEAKCHQHTQGTSLFPLRTYDFTTNSKITGLNIKDSEQFCNAN